MTIAFLLAFLLSGALLGAEPSRAELDAIPAAAYPAGEPGAAVLVVKNGEVLLRKGYGMANLELDVPIEPDMVFRIGSVTKQFTAAAILMLEERGKLSVTDDLREHLPDYPTQGRTITLEHLLTHTSGIRSYTDMESFAAYLREDLGVDEAIARFRDEPLAYEPGAKYAYNNSGYFLLGAVIERASGQTYEAFLEENVFEPLGMRDTYYGSATRIIERRASGYEEREGKFVNASYLSMTLPYAAGSLVSSADDLAKWDAALYDDTILSEASRSKWWEAYRLTGGERVDYGYGWGLSSYEGRFVAEHGGGINGFRCHVLRMPEERLYVAVLTNRAADEAGPALVARKLAAAAIGAPLEEPQSVSVDGSMLASYEGVYRPRARARYVVRLDEGKLLLRRFGDEHPEGGRVRDPGPSERLNRVAVELVPTSHGTFATEDSTLTARFENDGETLVVEDWGSIERAERTGESFEDEALVLEAIEILFEGMRTTDTDLIRSVLDADARLVATSTSEDGGPVVSSSSAEDFVDDIDAHTGPVLEERIFDPSVTIAGDLASVWAPYTFFVGDELSHCGEDAFQLVRSAAGWPGWKIVAIAYTRRQDCEDIAP